jgi:DNA-binding transcriptional ArsR family regulator
MTDAAFILLARAAGDPTRFRMLAALNGGPLCVGQLAGIAGMTSSAATYQTKLMSQAGLVVVERAGRQTIVRRIEQRWEQLLRAFAKAE